MELNLRSHWGALVRRWIYAILLLVPGAGLAFLTQYLWQIQWYTLMIAIAAVLLLTMIYNTLNTLRIRVTHNAAGDAIVIREGVFGTRQHVFRYDRLQSYRTRPSRIDDLLGCVQITLTGAAGAGEMVEYTLCLSRADCDALLMDLQQHLGGQ